jgi:hypothetical protein
LRRIRESSLDFSPFARGGDFSRRGRFSMDSERLEEEREASSDTEDTTVLSALVTVVCKINCSLNFLCASRM